MVRPASMGTGEETGSRSPSLAFRRYERPSATLRRDCLGQVRSSGSDDARALASPRRSRSQRPVGQRARRSSEARLPAIVRSGSVTSLAM